MRTTLEIDDGLIGEVMAVAKTKTKKKAIVTALEEYLKLKKKEDLIGLIGNYPTFDLTLDDLKKMRDDR